MPKEKLKKFKAYISNLLPHESDYLLSKINTSDTDKLDVFNAINKYVHRKNKNEGIVLNETIDKRKYSKILQWIILELNKVDVDLKLQWINETHELILLDKISPHRELQLISAAKKFQSFNFNFLKFYDMLIAFKHYLLIRMRYNEYQLIDQVTQKYHYEYQRSKLVYEQMQQATVDIIGLGGSYKREAIQWKNWLFQNFKDQQLDGLNRHMSAIRYIFVCLRYGAMTDLGEVLSLLDKFFKNGSNYSRRLLVNYYDNMLVYFDKMNNYNEAKHYGYLSIKYDQDDSIIYRNNLINLLIKNQQFEEALEVIESTNFRIKNTRNFHSVIGFISNHIRCLSKTNRLKEAVVKGRVFLKAYSNNIIKYRWHRFFAAYHGALLSQGFFSEIIKNTEKYKLHKKELSQCVKPDDKKIISIYYYLSLRMLKEVEHSKFKNYIDEIFEDHNKNFYDKELLKMIDELELKN